MSLFSSDVQHLAAYGLEGPSQEEMKPKLGDWNGASSPKDLGGSGAKATKPQVPILSVTLASGGKTAGTYVTLAGVGLEPNGLPTVWHLPPPRQHSGFRRTKPILASGLTGLPWASGFPGGRCRRAPHPLSCLHLQLLAGSIKGANGRAAAPSCSTRSRLPVSALCVDSLPPLAGSQALMSVG